jgi:predicted  nucleic acid-binding Zn-ribbon protein
VASSDSDPLSALRQSVARAIERIQELDAEREALKKQVDGLRGEVESLRAELSRLQDRWRSDVAEMSRLRTLVQEREVVKERIGHLLSRLDSLYLAE